MNPTLSPWRRLINAALGYIRFAMAMDGRYGCKVTARCGHSAADCGRLAVAWREIVPVITSCWLTPMRLAGGNLDGRDQ